MGFKTPQTLKSFRQNTEHRLFKAVSRLILLNLPSNRASNIPQPFLLSELPNEFDVEETLCINISEQYLKILRIFRKNETVLDVVRLSGRRGDRPEFKSRQPDFPTSPAHVHRRG